MTKLDAALLKLEGALDYTTDPQVRNLIDVARQAIETANQLTIEVPQKIDEKVQVIYAKQKQEGAIACMGGYQKSARPRGKEAINSASR